MRYTELILDAFSMKQGLDCKSVDCLGKALRNRSTLSILFQQNAIRKGESVAILFIDITSAFYRIIRQHVISVRGDARGPQELFRSLKLPPESFVEFALLLQQTDALEKAQAPAHLKAMFEEFFSSTWFVVRGDTAVVQTRKGSRPGDAFADLVFSFALTKLLRQAFDMIRSEIPDIGIWWDGTENIVLVASQSQWLPPLVPIWADDIAIALQDKSPIDLIQKVRKVTAVVFERLIAGGLMPNLQAGKSEILIDLRGPGSVQLRRQLLQVGNILSVPSAFGVFEVKLVGAYTHLGTWIQTGAGISKDAHDVLSRYRSQIFCNRGLSFERKQQFFGSWVLSTMMFNAAVWKPRNKRQETQLHNALFRLYRRCAAMHFGQKALKWSAIQLYEFTGFLQPGPLLVLSRLRYAGQLFRSIQPHLWALLQNSQQWKNQFEADLPWFGQYCPELQLLQQYHTSWMDFLQKIRSSVSRWKSWIRRAQNRCLAHVRVLAEWHGYQEMRLHEIGTSPPAEVQKGHYCLCCEKIIQQKSGPGRACFQSSRTCSRSTTLCLRSTV